MAPIPPVAPPEPPRSHLWPAVQAAHLARNPRCAACAAPGAPVQVHHIFPFHFCLALGRPDLELDQRNLITLCEAKAGTAAQDHHLLLGHLGDFESGNLEVAADAAGPYHDRSADQIRACPAWQKEAQARLKPLGQLTPAERTALRQTMDRCLPRL